MQSIYHLVSLYVLQWDMFFNVFKFKQMFEYIIPVSWGMRMY